VQFDACQLQPGARILASGDGDDRRRSIP